jgi:C-terminal processing protease CtpA/Prc
MACLLSETSASDGDIFPYYFREAGLGPLIGKRSWGGVVGAAVFGLSNVATLGDSRHMVQELQRFIRGGFASAGKSCCRGSR